jgi:hypothetical protein
MPTAADVGMVVENIERIEFANQWMKYEGKRETPKIRE